MKIRPIGTKYVPCRRTDGRTDGQTNKHEKANSRFS